MSGSWTSSTSLERVRKRGSARLSTFFDMAILFQPGRMRGKSGILVMRAGWPVGQKLHSRLFLNAPQNRGPERQDDHG